MFEGDGAQWEMFVQQARELLLSSRADLRFLEQQGNTVGPQVLERLIRIFHSIGSLSNFFKLDQISSLLERMEAILTIWREQPSLIDSSSTAALDAAFWLLHQSFTMDVSRSDHPILQEQIGILQDVLDNAAWKGAHKYLGTTPPFDLHDYPKDVAVAVAEGRHMFALHFPLPRTEQQRQLNLLLEQLITVGELVTSIPPMSNDFELEKTSRAFSVWLLFSTHLRQDLLMELTQLSKENLIPLPLPEMMRVAQATAEAVEQPREKKFTELVLRTLQSHLEKTSPVALKDPPVPESGATFEERKAEMELLALQIGQSNFQAKSFSRPKRPALGVILGMTIIALLSWVWNYFDIIKSSKVETKLVMEKNLPSEPHMVQKETLIPQERDIGPKNIIPTSIPAVSNAMIVSSSKQENSSDHAHTSQEDKNSIDAREITQDSTVRAVSLSMVSPTKKEEQAPTQIENSSVVSTSVSMKEDTGRLTPIFRETAALFTIIPPPNIPPGRLRFTRNCNGSITFSIASFVNQTISRKGVHLLISQETIQNIKLFLQNTKDTKGKAIMFDFDAAGQVTVAPTVWKSFIKNGSGVITVSHLFDHKNDISMIRDITAMTANNIPEQIKDQRKGVSIKSCPK
ncbi:hypothetical protein CCP3SC5AM1_1460003 [Gammaproteobacteria bacterium]